MDDRDERGVSDLVKDLSQQTSMLVRQELELARAELTQQGKQAGIGIGMFGAAGFLGFFAFAAVTTAIIAVLGTAMDTWIAALIVAAVYAAIAGILALQGRNKVREAVPPAPEQAVESVKEDVQWAKTRTQSARR